MNELSTKDAIRSLLYDPEVYGQLSESGKSTFRAYRKRLAENLLSTDKIEELLREYGYKVVQEKIWKEPRAKKRK
jgi:signal recognition particle subunit SEC65